MDNSYYCIVNKKRGQRNIITVTTDYKKAEDLAISYNAIVEEYKDNVEIGDSAIFEVLMDKYYSWTANFWGKSKADFKCEVNVNQDLKGRNSLRIYVEAKNCGEALEKAKRQWEICNRICKLK